MIDSNKEKLRQLDWPKIEDRLGDHLFEREIEEKMSPEYLETLFNVASLRHYLGADFQVELAYHIE